MRSANIVSAAFPETPSSDWAGTDPRRRGLRCVGVHGLPANTIVTGLAFFILHGRTPQIECIAGDKIRICDQPQDRQGAGPGRAFASPAARRRGDRLSMDFAAVRESGSGTLQTWIDSASVARLHIWRRTEKCRLDMGYALGCRPRPQSRPVPMSIQIIPACAALGAEIRGVDLSQPLDANGFAEIEHAYNKYGVIFFRNQRITPEH